MGSDTLSGTPGNQSAVAVFEVGSVASVWRTTSFENGAPATGNGVMWLMSTVYQGDMDQPSNLAFAFYYTFINTGPAVTGATMSCGLDNIGYIVLNGVKYKSTDVIMNLGYEGLSFTNLSVNIPPGLNTLEVRVVNMSGNPANTVWQNQGYRGGPTAAWMAITSGSTVLVKTTDKWRCTAFDYPAKFIGPLSLGDVGENAGLSGPYSLAALAGKVMYDNSANATTLTSPVSLFTAVGKTFVTPSYLIIITATSGGNRGAPTGNATSRLQSIVANKVIYSYSGGMVALLGFDASPYNVKDLSITYKNGTNGTVKTFYETANVDGNGSDYTSFTLSPSSPDNVTR
jgi:hypothetical protein